MLGFDLAGNNMLMGWVVLLRFTDSPELTNVHNGDSSNALGGPRRGLFRPACRLPAGFRFLRVAGRIVPFVSLLQIVGRIVPFALPDWPFMRPFLVPFRSASWKISRFQDEKTPSLSRFLQRRFAASI
jgi:hypothetical protein